MAEFCRAFCSAATCCDCGVDGVAVPALFDCERKYIAPPMTTAKSRPTEIAMSIQLLERDSPFVSSEEPRALSSRAPKASADAERFAPKLAPPLRLPKTARELSAGFSSVTGCSNSGAAIGPAAALG